MPSNPYMKASGAYRSATRTLPPVRGVAALLERCQTHCAGALRLAAEGQFQAYAGEVQAAINILTGLSLYLGHYLDKPAATAWERMSGRLILALGRAAAGTDMEARLRRCHDDVARLRQLWSSQAGLERLVEEPTYSASRQKQVAEGLHG